MCLSSFLVVPSGTRKCYKVSPEPFLFQAEQPKLFQPGTIMEMIQSFDHLRESPLDLLQFHILRTGCISWLSWTLHEFHTVPPLKPVMFPVDGIPSLWSLDCTTQFSVTSRLAEGTLNPCHQQRYQTAPVPTPISKECHLSLVSTWTLTCWQQLLEWNHPPIPNPLSAPSVSLPERQECHVGQCQMLWTNPGSCPFLPML